MTTRTGSARTASALGASHVSDYLRVLYRRRWTVALAIVVVSVYGAFQTLRKTPIYEATTQIMIEGESRRSSSLSSVLDQQASWYDEDFYQTQYRILQSRALAWRAAQVLGLHEQAAAASAAARASVPVEDRGLIGGTMDWIRDFVGAPEPIAPPPPDETTTQAQVTSSLLGGLAVIPIRNTRLVELRYRSPDPAFAARAANALAQEYINQTLDSRLGASREAVEYLSRQLEEQRQKVAESERALQTYKEQNDAIGVDDQQNIVVQRLQGLNGQYMEARAARIDKEALYTTLKALDRGDALDSFPAIMNNEFVQRLKGQLTSLLQERTQLLARYREGAPQIVQFDERIRDVERKLDTEISTVVASVEGDLRAARSREQSLSEELARQKHEATLLNRKGVEYAALRDEAASNRQLYETLLARTNETGVTGQFRGSNIQIIDPAETPRTPVLPNTKQDLLWAFLTGCAIAAGLAFGFEYLDNRIRTPDEIKTHLGLTFLGLVPAVSDKESGRDTPLISDDVPHAFGEALRAIRTAVVFSSAEDGARSVVVTSTGPGEGKTLVSSNLAVSLAQAGQRTLLIDADMRRPRIHEVFPMNQEPGLSNVLVGNKELHAVICATTTPHLHVLPAGHIPPNPAELLGSAKYRELLQDLRVQFDWIIIDAPPIMAVTDAAVVANEATGVIFVVGSEMTSRRNASAAIERLTAARARFIGGVLNRADVNRHSYYYSAHYRKDYTQAYARSSH
jgi:capsular exopolysaccharide synthesis family protein